MVLLKRGKLNLIKVFDTLLHFNNYSSEMLEKEIETAKK